MRLPKASSVGYRELKPCADVIFRIVFVLFSVSIFISPSRFPGSYRGLPVRHFAFADHPVFGGVKVQEGKGVYSVSSLLAISKDLLKGGRNEVPSFLFILFILGIIIILIILMTII